MTRSVDPRKLKFLLHQPEEIALLDVREAGQFGVSHLLYGVPLPYSRLEVDVGGLVPRLATPIVLYDSGDEGIAALSARRLEAHGYTDVRILEGGTTGWRSAGFQLFAGINVLSKVFGEIVENVLHTPCVAADELHAMMARGENLVIVDGRPYAEYQKMNIPGSICCPNGELAMRIAAIAPDPNTRIVVNCAGRTRSIIGAETLRRMGVPNPVYALENGTQGWFLGGFQLEHKSKRKYPDAPQGSNIELVPDNLRPRWAYRWSRPRKPRTGWPTIRVRPISLMCVRRKNSRLAACPARCMPPVANSSRLRTSGWVRAVHASCLLTAKASVQFR